MPTAKREDTTTRAMTLEGNSAKVGAENKAPVLIIRRFPTPGIRFYSPGFEHINGSFRQGNLEVNLVCGLHGKRGSSFVHMLCWPYTVRVLMKEYV